jgi:hypothetical protein
MQPTPRRATILPRFVGFVSVESVRSVVALLNLIVVVGKSLMLSSPAQLPRRIGRRSAWLAVRAFLFAAAVSLPELHAASDVGRSASAKPVAHAAPDRNQSIALSVVGPDGKAVPEIAVEVRGEPPITAEQIREGRFLRQGKNGIFVRSTAQGRLVLELPANPNRFEVLIETPGYAPYWARWNSEEYPEPVPSSFTAELGAAWSVGGVVVDGDGKPVEGARIAPRIHYKHRPDDFRGSYFGSHVTTDAAARWQFDSVPASQDDVVVTIDHPDFAPREQLATRWEFGLDRGRKPSTSIVLRRGLTVVGKVTDEAGKPIAGARVRTWFHHTIRKSVTGPDGAYRLPSCEHGAARVVVSAKGHALDMQEVHVAQGMEPVNFQMKPGGNVRVRVVDEHDKPIPRFHLLFQRWLGAIPFCEFDDVNPYADDRGVWEWRDATLDVFAADFICPGHETLSKQLVARSDEYVFRAEPALSVSGRVVDRETKKPVTRFLVGSCDRLSRRDRDWTFAAADGRYRLQTAQGDLNRAYVLRIEADGYEPAASRAIRGYEGNVTIDFELTRAQDFDASVLTPEGHAAVQAGVAECSDWHGSVQLTNGNIDAQSCEWRETDAGGRIHFPPQGPGSDLFITHASGYAEYHPRPKSNHRIIVLDPWTRVEGTYRVGGKPLAGIPVWINHRDEASGRTGDSRVFERHYTMTGAQGRFVFERVMAGRGSIGRHVRWPASGVSAAISSTSAVEAKFPLGETVHVDIEEKGRLVIGRLRAPAGFNQKLDWQSAVLELELQTNGDTPSSHFIAPVGADGTFRTDPLPGGVYLLDVRFLRANAGHLWDRLVVVPTDDNDSHNTQPLDLGVLTLDKN